MTNNPVQILRQMILAEAAYYDSQMGEIKLKMFVDELSDLSLEQIHRAYFNFRKDPKRQKMPMPSEVRQAVNPHMSDQNEAITAADLVIAAIGKFGYMRGQEAREYMGEVGWILVEQNGGWSYLCENTGVDIQVTTLKAQLRVQALSVIERAKAGVLTPPALPKSDAKSLSEQKRVSALINGATKGIPK